MRRVVLMVLNTVEMRWKHEIVLHWVSQLCCYLSHLCDFWLVHLSLSEVSSQDGCRFPKVFFRFNFYLLCIWGIDWSCADVDEFPWLRWLRLVISDEGRCFRDSTLTICKPTNCVHIWISAFSVRIPQIHSRCLLTLTWISDVWSLCVLNLPWSRCNQVWMLESVHSSWLTCWWGILAWVCRRCCHITKLLGHLLFKQSNLVILWALYVWIWCIWVKNVHCFEIERTNRSEECFLQIFLHPILRCVSDLNLVVCFVKAWPEHFNFFAVVCTDALDLSLHCFLEVFLVFFNLPCLVVLLPSLEDSSCPLFFAVS